MRSFIATLAACAFIAACGSTTTLRTVCIPLKAYTAAEQAAMARELEAMSDMDPIALAMADYGRMRAADRVCLAARP